MCLDEVHLTVRPEGQLSRAKVTYLGHIVGQGRRRPCEVKLAAVAEYPRPTTKRDIQSFLGLTGYCQHYILNYSDIASLLTDALRKTEPQKVVWNDTRQTSFQKLKESLTSFPILRTPNYDQPFIVQCDASDRGLGAVLCQRGEENSEHPVVYISRKLTTREEGYSASRERVGLSGLGSAKTSMLFGGQQICY